MVSSSRMTEARQWPKRLPALSVRRSTIAIENIPVFCARRSARLELF
jgi:hypothetical protein